MDEKPNVEDDTDLANGRIDQSKAEITVDPSDTSAEAKLPFGIKKPSEYHEKAIDTYPYQLSQLIFGSLLAAFILGFINYIDQPYGSQQYIDLSAESVTQSALIKYEIIEVWPGNIWLSKFLWGFTQLLVSVGFTLYTALIYVIYHQSVLWLDTNRRQAGADFFLAIAIGFAFGLSLLDLLITPALISFLIGATTLRGRSMITQCYDMWLPEMKTYRKKRVKEMLDDATTNDAQRRILGAQVDVHDSDIEKAIRNIVDQTFQGSDSIVMKSWRKPHVLKAPGLWLTLFGGIYLAIYFFVDLASWKNLIFFWATFVILFGFNLLFYYRLNMRFGNLSGIEPKQVDDDMTNAFATVKHKLNANELEVR